ncbi:MAG: hypothetical protein M1820_008784 [Bogoriella megaspora]|nr:MAG: hypothetical protein M1820_008784 [Bogoriella megaspora]
MANPKEDVSFDQIILESRKKKQNEALADQILGRGRKTGATTAGPSLGRHVHVPTGPASTLASRAGIMKVRITNSDSKYNADFSAQRSSSANITRTSNGKWQHDLHQANPPRARVQQLQRSQSSSRMDRGNRLFAGIQSELSKENGDSQANIVNRTRDGDLHIKGAAGPYTVVGSNFAPGTTAADIESVMVPIGGEIVSCKLICATPTVMVEMHFADKQGAEKVISTFNNKKADGRLLHVYMKQGGPSPPARKEQAPRQDRAPVGNEDSMDLDDARPTNVPTGPASDRFRRDRNDVPARRPVIVQDGRFGFGEDPPPYDSREYSRDRDYPRGRGARGLMSDSLMGNGSRWRR